MSRRDQPRPRHHRTAWTPPPGWPTPILTPRLHMRRLTRDDATAFHRLVDDHRDQLLPWMGWAATSHRTVAQTRDRLAELDAGTSDTLPDAAVIGLLERATGELVGACSIQQVDRPTASIGIGYWVAEPHTRRGLATEAVRHLLSVALRPAAAAGWGLNRVHMEAAGANTAARGVPQRLGLRREVRRRQHLHIEGVGVDDVCGWGVLADEWDADGHRMRRADPDPDVGVGPHPAPWPDDDRLDPRLLRDGDRRNVADRYRYWRHDRIVADLARTANPFHVAIENWRHDMNIGTVVRNANAFGAAGVHVVGRRSWNRRGAMVTDRYLQVHHHDAFEGLAAFAGQHGLALVGIDNLPGSASILDHPPPERAVLVLGQEGPGLSPQAREAVEVVLHIPQFGSTRSINAGVASGIAMVEWVRAHRPHA